MAPSRSREAIPLNSKFISYRNADDIQIDAPHSKKTAPSACVAGKPESGVSFDERVMPRRGVRHEGGRIATCLKGLHNP